MSLRTGLAALLMVSAAPLAGLPATFRVPEDFTRIQQACDSASNGDTILLGTLRDSLWVEDVTTVGKALVIRSAAGPHLTQIRRRIRISNAGTADTTRILGIRWNTGSSRHALWVGPGNFVIEGCAFDTSNECHVNGTIIPVEDYSSVTLTRCTFVAQPYTIAVPTHSSVRISGCIFTRSCKTAVGPSDGYLSVQYCCFWDNANDADSSIVWGPGNIPFDPMLSEPDMTLLPGSPCIDAGDPAMPVPPGGGGRIDIGAYEYQQPVAVSEGAHVPGRFGLEGNSPNPFNSSTQISYVLPYSTHASLTIHDLLGRLVVTLVDEAQSAGRHVVTWDGRDREGRDVGSGVYLYGLRAGDVSGTRKLLILK